MGVVGMVAVGCGGVVGFRVCEHGRRNRGTQ